MTLIKQDTVDQLAKDLDLDVTDDVKRLIVVAINSIDQTALYNAVNEKLKRELRSRGITS